MGKLGKIARRTFLIGTTAVAGGVAFGYWRLKQPFPNPLEHNLPQGYAPIGDYVLLGPQGVTLITPRAEMGQGIQSALATLLAEELELPWDQVQFAHGPPSKAYFNSGAIADAIPHSPFEDGTASRLIRGVAPLIGKVVAMQVTGGSSSVPDGWEKMRVAGAAARETLKLAAAKLWSTKVASLRAKDGKIQDSAGRSIAYKELAQHLSGIEIPSDLTLKPKSAWTYIGKSMPRLDIPDKVTGKAKFSGDYKPEGLVYASLRLNPYRGPGLDSYDAKAALAVDGVSKIVEVQGGLAVVAKDSWSAMQGAKALTVNWKRPDFPDTMEGQFDACKRAFDGDPASARDDGDCDQALEDSALLSAEYRAPYLAHACMEPVNATVKWQGDQLEMWVGNQNPTEILGLLEKNFQFNPDDAKIHISYLGGGFGRKLEVDYVDYALQVAKALPGQAVQVFFDRTQDLQQDFYRPLALARAKGLVKDKKIHALELKTASLSLMESMAARGAGPEMPGPDPMITMTLNYQPYEIPHYRCQGYRVPKMLPVASWRSVGASQNAFFHESMLDELCVAASLDPVQARMDIIKETVCREVIHTVATMSDWGKALPKGRARGLAFWVSFGVPVAEVVEIEQTKAGIAVRKVYVAADVGVAIDPRNVQAQLISAVNWGLGAAMFNEITLQGGQIKQSNFHDFAPLRMYQAPEIVTKVLEDNPHVRGIGEPGVPPAAPALANAIYALTQKRLREMPFSKTVDFV